jgi:hypothetical protein
VGSEKNKTKNEKRSEMKTTMKEETLFRLFQSITQKQKKTIFEIQFLETMVR